MRTGFATKSAALDDLHRIQEEKADGSYVEPTRLTLGQYLEGWIAAGCGGVRVSTFTGYRIYLRRHVIPRLGGVRLQSLTRPQIQAMYQELATAGNARGGGLAPKTLHNIQLCVHAALEEAVRNRLIPRNPSDASFRKPRDRPEMQTWTVEELRMFLKELGDDEAFPLYRVAAQTGMRRGELLGMRWRDVDLVACVLSVRQQWSRAGGVLRFGPPKTRNALRTIELDAGTVEALRAHREVQEFCRRSWGEEYRADLDLVFPRQRGEPQDPDVVSKRFGRLVRSLGKNLAKQSITMRAIRFHDLRHTHATLLLEEGFDAKYVSERLGHESVRTTLELYGHVTSKRRWHAAEQLGRMLDGTAGLCDPVVIPLVENGAEPSAERGI